MTQKEMVEIFAVMLLAYPNAETFKGGIQKLGPTIELWTACLPEVDFWTGQQAVIKLCRECKFPPTIAEFKEKADAVKSEVRKQIDQAWDFLRMPMKFRDATPLEAYNDAPDMTKAAINAMGGPDKLVITVVHEFGDGSKRPVEEFNYYGFRDAYEHLLRIQSALPGKPRAVIGTGRPKQIGEKTA